MSTTLYRKYRPTQFRDVVGQLHVRSTLLAELAGGMVAHAYLFVGPRGVGKTSIARLLAKAVNCQKPKNGEPDNSCPSCAATNEGRSLDLVEIDAASHTQVDHVREHILPAARTAPSIGKYKVFIIDEVHMLSSSAFNALLKILEEPPTHVIFILATTEAHRVPATIISRCQRFDFHRLSADETVQRLNHVLSEEGKRADRDVLLRIARLSQGSLRDAESMLGQLTALSEKHITSEMADIVLPRSDVQSVLQLLSHIFSQQHQAAFELVERLIDDGIQVAPFMNESIEILRTLLLKAHGIEQASSVLLNSDAEQAEQILQTVKADKLRAVIDIFIRRLRDERYASLPQIPLELAVAEALEQGSIAPTPVILKERQNTASKQEKSKEKPETRKGISLTETTVTAKWPQVIEVIRQSNPSLAVLLNSASPRAIVDAVLTLNVPFEFHRERLTEPRNNEILVTAIRNAFSDEVALSIVVAAVESAAPAKQSDVWQQALEAFGG